LGYEELRLLSDDGISTQAWWIPYAGPPERALGVAVVTFHGNAGTMADRLEHTRLLHDLGASVLTAEYRGYGDSEGSPSEEGLAADARAALAALRERAGPRGERAIVHGRSLGGAVAVRLASDESVDGLIVESTFTSLPEMAASTAIPLARRLVAYRFDSEERLASITTPLLVVHGDRDEMIPLAMGRRLHAAAGGPAELLVVAGGTHNDTWIRGGEAYWACLRAFLNEP
jgi:fermentation-respiration switch protein FrsA (DUF1100 family)